MGESGNYAGPPLAGRAVVVTGAGGMGIGRGVVEALSAAGAAVIGVDMSESALSALQTAFPDVMTIVGDVSDEHDVDRIAERATSLVGAVDGLVNNAGIGLNQPFYTAQPEQFDRLFAVDVRGTWLMSRAISRDAITTGHPLAIVNVSSVHGEAVAQGYSIYAGAKAAVNGLTRGMAADLGPFGIRCNAIAPGYVHAEQNRELIRGFTTDPERWIQRHVEDFQVLTHEVNSADCGAAVVFLLSDASRSTTGQIVNVDAGLTLQLYSNSFVRNSK